jgi:hypothetical protein
MHIERLETRQEVASGRLPETAAEADGGRNLGFAEYNVAGRGRRG